MLDLAEKLRAEGEFLRDTDPPTIGWKVYLDAAIALESAHAEGTKAELYVGELEDTIEATAR